MMVAVGRLGRILGFYGINAQSQIRYSYYGCSKGCSGYHGKVEYRVDRIGIIHVPIGKASFDTEKLNENFSVLMDAIIKAKPASAKGTYLRSVVLSSTMGPGVKINPSAF